MEKKEWTYRMRVDPIFGSKQASQLRYSFWKYNEEGEWFLMATTIHNGSEFIELLVFRAI